MIGEDGPGLAAEEDADKFEEEDEEEELEDKGAEEEGEVADRIPPLCDADERKDKKDRFPLMLGGIHNLR